LFQVICHTVVRMKSKQEHTEAAKSASSPIEVQLKFTLPACRAEFEDMLDGQKWKQLVADLRATVTHWQLTTENEEHRSAYKGVCLQLRDYMADAGLTLADPKIVEAERQKRSMRYSEAFAKTCKEANKNWGISNENEHVE
jgi:hypothetical protein